MTRSRETRMETARPRPARRRHGVVVTLAAIGAAFVAAVLLTVVVALGVRDELERRRAELVSGRAALLAGRLDEAAADFDEARERFEAASDRAGSSPGAISAQRIPVLGRTVDVLGALADAASASAGTITQVTAGIADLPGGVDGLISPDGTRSPWTTPPGWSSCSRPRRRTPSKHSTPCVRRRRDSCPDRSRAHGERRSRSSKGPGT